MIWPFLCMVLGGVACLWVVLGVAKDQAAKRDEIERMKQDYEEKYGVAFPDRIGRGRK